MIFEFQYWLLLSVDVWREEQQVTEQLISFVLEEWKLSQLLLSYERFTARRDCLN